MTNTQNAAKAAPLRYLSKRGAEWAARGNARSCVLKLKSDHSEKISFVPNTYFTKSINYFIIINKANIMINKLLINRINRIELSVESEWYAYVRGVRRLYRCLARIPLFHRRMSGTPETVSPLIMFSLSVVRFWLRMSNLFPYNAARSSLFSSLRDTRHDALRVWRLLLIFQRRRGTPFVPVRVSNSLVLCIIDTK